MLTKFQEHKIKLIGRQVWLRFSSLPAACTCNSSSSGGAGASVVVVVMVVVVLLRVDRTVGAIVWPVGVAVVAVTRRVVVHWRRRRRRRHVRYVVVMVVVVVGRCKRANSHQRNQKETGGQNSSG